MSIGRRREVRKLVAEEMKREIMVWCGNRRRMERERG